jgi:hypothetical protein
MDDLLTYGGFIEPCNVCGESYILTLRDVLLEQQVSREWTRVRPSCESCRVQHERLVDVVPAKELENLGEAWRALSAALDDRNLQLHPSAASR